jgi:N6-adenosine-specific RNA methylase IME4
MVDEICAGHKLDYFARKKREGWEAFGDEVKS